ncbi:24276_t:CDS:2, partial [Racocetra persica]
AILLTLRNEFSGYMQWLAFGIEHVKSGKHSLREVLVEWIAKDSLPFITIESESFSKLFEIIRNIKDLTKKHVRK